MITELEKGVLLPALLSQYGFYTQNRGRLGPTVPKLREKQQHRQFPTGFLRVRRVLRWSRSVFASASTHVGHYGTNYLVSVIKQVQSTAACRTT